MMKEYETFRESYIKKPNRKKKSQRKCKLYNQGAFKVLVEQYGLIDPSKKAMALAPVKV